MTTNNRSLDLLLWAQISFAVTYGIFLPIGFCLSQGWNWAVWMPTSSIWLLINLPVIETWIPKLVKTLARRYSRLRAAIQDYKGDFPFSRLVEFEPSRNPETAEIP